MKFTLLACLGIAAANNQDQSANLLSQLFALEEDLQMQTSPWGTELESLDYGDEFEYSNDEYDFEDQESAVTLLNSYFYGTRGQDVSCKKSNQIITHQCGSGARSDCHGKSAFQYARCTTMPGVKPKHSTWVASKWGQTVHCDGNSAATGMCTSGTHADCSVSTGRQKQHHKLRCTEFDKSTLEILRNECRTVLQLSYHDGEDCPSGTVMTGRCASGRKKDCRGDSVTAMECCNYKIPEPVVHKTPIDGEFVGTWVRVMSYNGDFDYTLSQGTVDTRSDSNTNVNGSSFSVGASITASAKFFGIGISATADMKKGWSQSLTRQISNSLQNSSTRTCHVSKCKGKMYQFEWVGQRFAHRTCDFRCTDQWSTPKCGHPDLCCDDNCQTCGTSRKQCMDQSKNQLLEFLTL